MMVHGDMWLLMIIVIEWLLMNHLIIGDVPSYKPPFIGDFHGFSSQPCLMKPGGKGVAVFYCFFGCSRSRSKDMLQSYAE